MLPTGSSHLKRNFNKTQVTWKISCERSKISLGRISAYYRKKKTNLKNLIRTGAKIKRMTRNELSCRLKLIRDKRHLKIIQRINSRNPCQNSVNVMYFYQRNMHHTSKSLNSSMNNAVVMLKIVKIVEIRISMPLCPVN